MGVLPVANSPATIGSGISLKSGTGCPAREVTRKMRRATRELTRYPRQTLVFDASQ